MIDKNQYSIIDIDYFEDFNIKGLETVIDNKETRIIDLTDKNDEFKEEMNTEGGIIIIEGKQVPSHTILKTTPFKKLYGAFRGEYNTFDGVVFTEKTVYGSVKQTETNYRAIDGILEKVGFTKPTTKSREALKQYRSIFWYARRRLQIPKLEEELKELKDYKDKREEEDNSSWNETLLDDYEFEDSFELDIDW